MKIAITAESTIDLSNELLMEYNIKTIPFTILLGDEIAIDGSLPTQEIFDFVEKNKILPKTSAINEYQYEEFFKEVLKEYDQLIHISLSSEISCACANAINASKKFDNVLIVDSQSLSTGIALLAIKGVKMVKEGCDATTIYNQLCEDTKKLQVSFIINKLDYLKKGGRCSSIALLGANLLKIKPQIIVKQGKMVSGKKYMGNFDACVKKYCDDVLSQNPNADKSVAFVTYTSASETADRIAKDALKNAGFEKIYQTTAGGTIASHCGPNTLGILFLNK